MHCNVATSLLTIAPALQIIGGVTSMASMASYSHATFPRIKDVQSIASWSSAIKIITGNVLTRKKNACIND